MRVVLLLFLFVSFLSFSKTDSLSVTDNTLLEIKNGKEIFNPESDWWDKYSSGAIAAITVFLSLWISVRQGRRTLKHNKANSISEARIKWIQELRPLLGKLIWEATLLSAELKKLGKHYDSETKKIKEDLSEGERKYIDESLAKAEAKKDEFELTFNQIKLFLKRDEPDHRELMVSVDSYWENAKREIRENDFVNEISSDQLIEKARTVLINAWEQAKAE